MILWVSGVPSQFPHPHIGTEGQPSSAYWGEDERRCDVVSAWHTAGVQNVGRKSLYSPLNSNTTPTFALAAVVE